MSTPITRRAGRGPSPAEILAMSKQQAHIVASCCDLSAAVDTLTRMGLTVLRAELGGHRPVIWIQNDVRTGRLDSAAMVTTHGPCGIEHVMVARVGECQAHWRVRGH